MLKRGLAYTLIVCTLTANFARLFEFAGFQLNQQYIATTLCVNKNKPWLHCNGRCYLMKKIKQVQEKEKNDERQAQKNLFQDAFFSGSVKITFPACLLQTFPARYYSPQPQNVTKYLLRPPRVA